MNLWGQIVSIQCDNKWSVLAYILLECGTQSTCLMALTRELLCLADHWQIEFRPCYLPGEASVEADALSRNQVVVELQLWPDLLKVMFWQYGPPQFVGVPGQCGGSPLLLHQLP